MYVRDGFRVLEGWVRVNGGRGVGGDVPWFREVVGELDLLRMPLEELRDVLEGCEYVDGVWAAGVLERKQAAGENLHEMEYKTVYKVERKYDLGGDFGSLGPGKIALHGEGSEQRMAITDSSNHSVVIMSVESGERLATVGSRGVGGSNGYGPGLLNCPYAVAFSGAGELYVCSISNPVVQLFDRQGQHLRGFGAYGREPAEGRFLSPAGLCFTAGGNLVVADKGNHRVQVIQEDGTFVPAFGSEGSGEGEFKDLADVCVGPDGSIAVLDGGNHRVQMFDGQGVFVRSFGSKGTGPGQFESPKALAAGGRGEIIVSDSDGGRNDVQIFSPDGELLLTIAKETL